jgi:hypothetical protein
MLDRIKIVGLNLDSSKTGTYGGQFKKHNQDKNFRQSNSDNLSRSEALLFLLERNWHIQKILFPDEKKISVTFLVSDLEFKTRIDFSELNQMSEISYSIASIKEINNEKKKLTASITTGVSDNGQWDHIIDIELNDLKALIRRLFSLNISNELSSEDSSVLNNIFDDIKESVYNDLSYITGCLLKFIFKLTGTRVNILTQSQDKYISLTKIKVETLEAN